MPDVVADARWWAGIPLSERYSGVRAANSDATTRGELRLRLWEEGRFVPDARSSLVEHYAAEGVSKDTVVSLLGEPTHALRDRLPEPSWLRVIRRAWPRATGGSPNSPCRCGGTGIGELDLPTDAAFLRWIAPLTGWARQELRDRVRASAMAWPPVEPDHPLLEPDPAQLIPMIKRVLVLELNFARVRGELCGTTSRARFACFCRSLERTETAIDLLAEYPVLARELVGHCQQWIAVRLELCTRLRADLPLLRGMLNLPRNVPVEVTGLRFGAGDRHRDGRTVVIVELNGTPVVYKPRPLAGERRFAEFVRWLTGQGLTHPLRVPEILDRGDYGWTEHVTWQPCSNPHGLQRFYWRLGAHVAVFHLLGGYDMHMSNMIANGTHPVFIDLEAMFHAPSPTDDEGEHGPAVGAALRESVLASLVLPQPIVTFHDDETHTVDISALAGGIGPEAPDRSAALGYVDDGTDTMRVRRQPRPEAPGRNRPVPANVEVDHAMMAAWVEAGFESCYRLLLARRDVLLAAGSPVTAFADDRFRAVLRDTAVYRSLLDESWHPDLLRDALDREHFIGLLTTRGNVARHRELAGSELRQLARGDIPVFTVRAAGTALSDPDGETQPDFRPMSGMARVRQRIERMSERDLDEQRWYVRASLATIPGIRPPSGGAPVPDADHSLDAGLAIRAAEAIADRLLRTVLRHESGPEWLSLNLLGGTTWVIGRTSLGLASGVTGVALFLAELDNLAGSPRCRQLAEEIVGGLLTDPLELDDLAGMSIGAYEDLGSVLYLLARLRELWGPDFSLEPLEWLLPALCHNVPDDPRGDVMGGVAGAALSVLRLHRVRPVPGTVAQLARVLPAAAARCPPRVGLGHGLSGCAYALAALGEVTDDPHLIEETRALLRTERELIIRQSGAGGWCDGMAGVALARAAMLALPRCAPLHAELTEDLRASVDRIHGALTAGEPADDSLCHGRLGMLEALRTAHQHGDGTLDPLLDRALADLAHRVLAGRLRTGVPTGVWTPGLLTGAAGVGYGLLRAAAPHRIPDILTLS